MAPITPQAKRKRLWIVGGLFIVILAGIFVFSAKAQWVINTVNVGGITQLELFEAFKSQGDTFKPLTLPEKEEHRFDIALIGIRGKGEEFGGLLTDTILLLSINTDTGQTAMVSIPRDLYIPLPYGGKIKINEAYAIGYDKGGEKLALSVVKTILSQITGVYVDGVIRADFEGFRRLVDTVGGVDIYLEDPFIEIAQWQGIGGFRLPAGWNHLNGQDALFFVRSRFSTSDFDRARRQQEFLLALKDRVVSLGILSNPVKIYSLLDIVGTHVRTDLDMDVSEGLALVNKIDYRSISRLVLSTQNYLYQTKTPTGSYILLPKEDNFAQMQSAIVNIFTLDIAERGLTPAIPIIFSQPPDVNEQPVNNNNSLQNASTTLGLVEDTDEEE